MVEMKTQDSKNPSFNAVMTSAWPNMVKDLRPRVQPFYPHGMGRYVPEDFTTPEIELRNTGYVMIEPQLSDLEADADFDKGLSTENLKFSVFSGFIIQVFPPATVGAQPHWKLICYQATDTTALGLARIILQHGITRWVEIRNQSSISLLIRSTTRMTLITRSSPPRCGPAVIQRGLVTALLDAIVSVPYRDSGTLPLAVPYSLGQWHFRFDAI